MLRTNSVLSSAAAAAAMSLLVCLLWIGLAVPGAQFAQQPAATTPSTPAPTLPSGLHVNSYLLHSDPVGHPATMLRTATIGFTSDILGVIEK